MPSALYYFANATDASNNVPAGTGLAASSTSYQVGQAEAIFSSPNGTAIDAAGNVYVVDTANHSIRKITPAGVVSIFAGSATQANGSADGMGLYASFKRPQGIAIDPSGNLYVGDTDNHTIRKITPEGVVTTLAGLAGTASDTDGTGSAARFNYPVGIAVDNSGGQVYLYVADASNNKIRKIAAGGVVTTLSGGTYSNPQGIALNATEIYVADTSNNKIQVITKSTGAVALFVGQSDNSSGFVDDIGANAKFSSPIGLALDGNGNLYVCDFLNDAIRKVVLSTSAVTTWAGSAPGGSGSGSANGTGTSAQFFHPAGLCIDASGNMYIADSGNSSIRKATSSAVVTTYSGSATILSVAFSNGGPASLSSKHWKISPSSTGAASQTRAYDDGETIPNSSGNVYNLYPGQNAAYYYANESDALTDKNQIGANYDSYIVGNSRTTALFNFPVSTAVDGSGNVYVADSGNNAIRKITPAGVVSTFAGTGSSGSTDGTGTNASFNAPQGVATDTSGNVYVADAVNHTIRKITPAGVVTTIAGSAGTSGSTNATGTSARFYYPAAVVLDSAGNVYVADSGNNAIRKITSAGVVTTFAGTGSSGFVNGTGTSASFLSPSAIAIDVSGSLYVVDTGNNAIRKITTPGAVVTTLAGGGGTSPGTSGFLDATGTAALFNIPGGVCVDGSGNLYVSDTTNFAIRVVAIETGLVTTLAGSTSQVAGYADGVGTDARFLNPSQMSMDASGNIYVADGSVDDGNHNIRVVVASTGVVTTLAGSMVGGYEGAGFQNGLARLPTTRWIIAENSTGATTGAVANGATLSSSNSPSNYYLYPAPNIVYYANQSFATGEIDPLAVNYTNYVVQHTDPRIALFNGPTGIATDASGNMYVADNTNYVIRKITPAGAVSLFAGNPGTSGSADGAGTNAEFSDPRGVAVDGSGNIYVTEAGASAIRKITPAGVVSTFGSIGVIGSPTGITIDASGNLYVTDQSSGIIYKVTPAGSASSFVTGFSTIITGIVIDSSGTNLYVTDGDTHIISKIVISTHAVTTLAGTSGTSGSADGTGTNATFSAPYGMVVDPSGNLYVTDQSNNNIRHINTATGVVTTFAGSPTQSSGHADGIGGAATFNAPGFMTIDTSGNIFVADVNNNTIRKITPGAAVTLFAGSPTQASGYRESGLVLENKHWAIASSSTGTADQTRNYDPGNTLTAGGVYNLYPSLNAMYYYPSEADALADTNQIATSYTAAVVGHTDPSPLFNQMNGVAKDSSGNIYVADTGNHAIRKITPSGVVSTLAGNGISGTADGTGTNAEFSGPGGVAVDGSGNVYVADTNNNRIRVVTPAGVVTTLAGSTSGFTDDTGTNAQFAGPVALVIDGAGNLFVSDQGNNRIRAIVISSGVVTTFAGGGDPGFTDGTGTNAQFNYQTSIAIDSYGNLYVTDTTNQAIRKITTGGVVTTLAGGGEGHTGAAGFVDATGSSALFNGPSGVAVNQYGNLYVSDTGNYAIRVVTISSGSVGTLAGGGPAPGGTHTSPGQSGFRDGPGADALFIYPAQICIDSAGKLYVADLNNIRCLDTPSVIVTTIAGDSTQILGYRDGAPPPTLPSKHWRIASTSVGPSLQTQAYEFGDRLVADQGVYYMYPGTNAIYYYGSKADAVAGTSLIATSFTSEVLGHTDAYPAFFRVPVATAIDASGNIYVADKMNNCIRKITPDGAVTTLAGRPASGSSDGTGTAAQFYRPSGVALDASGNLYVADTSNHTIRVITPAGVVTTLAGTAGTSGSANDTGTNAKFYQPVGVAVDASGNVYVGDSENNMIRMVTSVGVVTTFAGSISSGFVDGTGTNAKFNNPNGLAIDASGNLYVADAVNNAIRKITTPAAVVTTLAGGGTSFAGTSGFTDDTGTAALFYNPIGVSVGLAGNLYVADNGNHAIRAIVIATGVVTTIAGGAGQDPGTAGFANGVGTNALFRNPRDVAIDTSGNIYVADSNNQLIRMINSGGAVTTFAGVIYDAQAGAISTDGGGPGPVITEPFWRFTSTSVGTANPARAYSLGDTLSTGDVYYMYPAPNAITYFGSEADALALTNNLGASFSSQLVGHTDITTGGALTYTSWQIASNSTGATPSAGQPYNDGAKLIQPNDEQGYYLYPNITNELLYYPTQGDASGSTNLLGASYTSYAVGHVDGGAPTLTPKHWKISATGTTGTASQDYVYDNGYELTPAGVYALYPGRNPIYYYENQADAENEADHIAASFSSYVLGNQNTIAPMFSNPASSAIDASGNIYVADLINNSIRKITPQGVVTTFAGSTAHGWNDGTGTAASFNMPTGICIDSVGILYVADSGNSSIRVIDIATGIVTTLAGSPTQTPGYADGTGTNAMFSGPTRVCVDTAGNLYVADAGNQNLRKVATATGIVTTLAGSPAQVNGYADGTGTNALFSTPAGLAVDSTGNVYVADSNNHCIRVVSSVGVVTTFAGDHGVADWADGTGTNAEFNAPIGLTFDPSGTKLYVADSGNNVIRSITISSAVVTTFAGNHTSSGSTNGTGTNAKFNFPYGVSTDASGNVFVSDGFNNTIRKITPAAAVTTFAGVAETAGYLDGGGPGPTLGGRWLMGTNSVTMMDKTLTYNTGYTLESGGGTAVYFMYPGLNAIYYYATQSDAAADTNRIATSVSSYVIGHTDAVGGGSPPTLSDKHWAIDPTLTTGTSAATHSYNNGFTLNSDGTYYLYPNLSAIYYYPTEGAALADTGCLAMSFTSYVVGNTNAGGGTGTSLSYTSWRIASTSTGSSSQALVYNNGTTLESGGTYFLYPSAPCFLEGSTILCSVGGIETWLPVEQIRQGTLVKTSRNGYKPVVLVGKGTMLNLGTDERTENRLYRCSKEKYPALKEDLYITGCHSILEDKITDVQREKTIKQLSRVFVTDKKYRLMACIDERAEPWLAAGNHTIWNFALENTDIYMNYGIYANGGLLVESSNIRFMRDRSNMEFL